MSILKKVKSKDFVEHDILFSCIKIIIFFNFDKIFIQPFVSQHVLITWGLKVVLSTNIAFFVNFKIMIKRKIIWWFSIGWVIDSIICFFVSNLYFKLWDIFFQQHEQASTASHWNRSWYHIFLCWSFPAWEGGNHRQRSG